MPKWKTGPLIHFETVREGQQFITAYQEVMIGGGSEFSRFIPAGTVFVKNRGLGRMISEVEGFEWDCLIPFNARTEVRIVF